MYIKATLVLVMMFLSISAMANCVPRTDYERIYCEIVEQGEGKGLPRFEDFRRNDVTVQQLLLKRPAAKLKITLPNSPNKAAVHQKQGLSKSTQSERIKKTTIKPLESRISEASSVSFSNCTVGGNIIVCGTRRFNLKMNEPNSRLAPGVLDDKYKMALPPYRGDAQDEQEVQFYLSGVYGRYIERMVDIGLGASTMSYARFYHTFYDLQAKNVDFSERFETMYRFLKKDKKTMVVKSEPSTLRPRDISQCDDVTSQIIVCDMGRVNWVYTH